MRPLTHRPRAGVTLLEVLITSLVVGIVAATWLRSNSRDAQRTTSQSVLTGEVLGLVSALDVEYERRGGYPLTVSWRSGSWGPSGSAPVYVPGDSGAVEYAWTTTADRRTTSATVRFRARPTALCGATTGGGAAGAVTVACSGMTP